jgi:protoporphyrin/coproporphyrin ferrochelatase
MTDAVLLMAYGTPSGPDAIEGYYTHIRRGRPPTPELLDDLARRYDAIGGTSPLLERTAEQVAGVAAALGPDVAVTLGMKHAPPFIEDAMATLAGHERVAAVVLAPHDSAGSVGEYLARVDTAAAPGQTLCPVRSWHLEPGLIEALATRVRATAAGMPADIEVVFTAHSLPARVVAADDPYVDQVHATAAAVAEAAGVTRWSRAWQSAGRTADTWIGPDIADVIRDKAAAGVAGVLVCPVGFVADSLEVLYDLDILAASVAADCGVAFARTPSLNADPALCATVADVARRALAR